MQSEIKPPLNKWTELAEKYKGFVKETNEWIKSNDFCNLPESVQTVLVRGMISCEDNIQKYEKWAREENEKAKE